MELLILVCVIAAILLFNAIGIGIVVGRGGPRWDRQAQREAGVLLGAIVAAGVAIGAVVFGVAALVAIWPFWLLFGVMVALFFAIGEWRARGHERQSLDARLMELERRGPLPPWAADIRERRNRR